MINKTSKTHKKQLHKLQQMQTKIQGRPPGAESMACGIPTQLRTEPPRSPRIKMQTKYKQNTNKIQIKIQTNTNKIQIKYK